MGLVRAMALVVGKPCGCTTCPITRVHLAHLAGNRQREEPTRSSSPGALPRRTHRRALESLLLAAQLQQMTKEAKLDRQDHLRKGAFGGTRFRLVQGEYIKELKCVWGALFGITHPVASMHFIPVTNNQT